MLHRLSSDHPSFKTFEFRNGLNIIVADRANSEGKNDQAERQRRTRNGAGKSSILDIVHFVLGGRPEGALSSERLGNWSFQLLLDVGGQRLLASRNLADPKNVRVKREATTVYPEAESQLAVTKWIQALGEAWFALALDRPPGSPSFRQLISYFARRRRDGGYDDPVRTFRAQSSAVTETNLAVLFDLDAELVRRLHQAKAALKRNQTAQKALRELEMNAPAGGRRIDLEAQLSAEIAATALTRDRLRDRISSFNVLPAFRELERELADLNQEARDLSDRDVLDHELITISQRDLSTESLPKTPQLELLFREANVIFPDLVARRYDDVVKFHQRLIENRQAHLASEIDAAKRRIRHRTSRRQALEQRRRQITEALQASGPADELLRLRDELSQQEANLRGLEARLREARNLERHAETLEQEIEEAARALRQDRRERSDVVDQASRAFSEISERLYEQPGQLAISATESGLRFLPSAPADKSAGVMSMEIFCFDLTIALLCRRRGIGPGFLMHDSHLFEPVDGRQFARALRIAADFSINNNLQYIVTLNSDELARAELEGSEDFSRYILAPKLSDAPDGGLFGFRFD